MDGVLHDVSWAHGLFEAAGDALHGGTAACREEAERGRARGGHSISPCPQRAGTDPTPELSSLFPPGTPEEQGRLLLTRREQGGCDGGYDRDRERSQVGRDWAEMGELQAVTWNTLTLTLQGQAMIDPTAAAPGTNQTPSTPSGAGWPVGYPSEKAEHTTLACFPLIHLNMCPTGLRGRGAITMRATKPSQKDGLNPGSKTWDSYPLCPSTLCVFCLENTAKCPFGWGTVPQNLAGYISKLENGAKAAKALKRAALSVRGSGFLPRNASWEETGTQRSYKKTCQ